MRKILKPAKVFWTKQHSLPSPILEELQTEVFEHPKIKAVLETLMTLSVETRLQILFALSRKNWVCVGDLAAVLRLNISAVSHQLRLLREQKLVQNRRNKKVVYYSLSNQLPRLIEEILQEAAS